MEKRSSPGDSVKRCCLTRGVPIRSQIRARLLLLLTLRAFFAVRGPMGLTEAWLLATWLKIQAATRRWCIPPRKTSWKRQE